MKQERSVSRVASSRTANAYMEAFEAWLRRLRAGSAAAQPSALDAAR